MSTGAVSAALIRAERRLIERLRQAGAINPGAAGPLAELRRVEARRLGRLQASGVIHEPEPGRYYLDEAAYASYRGRRRIAILGIVVAIAALAAWLAWRG